MKEETKNKVRSASNIGGTIIGSCASSLIGWGFIGLGRSFMKPNKLNKVISAVGGFGVGIATNRIFGKAIEEEISECTESVIELVDMMQSIKEGECDTPVENDEDKETTDA